MNFSFPARFGRVSMFPKDKQGTFLQACAAESHSCALDVRGKISCWGLNTLDRAQVPVELKNVKWKDLSCSGGHTCAISSNGWPACWGFGQHGQVNQKKSQMLIFLNLFCSWICINLFMTKKEVLRSFQFKSLVKYLQGLCTPAL